MAKRAPSPTPPPALKAFIDDALVPALVARFLRQQQEPQQKPAAGKAS